MFVSDRTNFPLVIAALKYRFLKGRPAKVILIETDKMPVFDWLLHTFAHVDPCPDDLGDYENKNGVHLFQDREKYLLETYNKEIDQFDFQEIVNLIPTIQNSENIQTFISRHIVHDFASQYAAALLTKYFALNAKNKIDRVFMENHLASQSLEGELLAATKVQLYHSSRLLLSDLKNIARILRLRVQLYWSKVKTSSHNNLKTGKLAVQYVHGPHNRGYGTDFDWLKYSDLKYEDIIYLIENKNKLLSVNISHLEEKGLNAIDISSCFLNLKTPETQNSLKNLFQNCCHVILRFQGSLRQKLRLAAAISFHGCVYIRWLDFYRTHNILGYVNIADTNLDALPKTQALEYFGGVDLSYEFSATGYHACMDARPLARHQYICWGSLSKKSIYRCDRGVPYRLLPKKIMYAGNMKLYLQHHLLPEQSETIHSITNHPASHKFLVMDSTATHLKLLSQRKQDSFYEAILELIDDRPDDLFIIKPQRALQLRNNQMQKFESLKKKGRLILVPHFGLFHYLLPVVDLVIGMPIYASCIAESCAARKPVICFNQTKWPHLMLDILPKPLLVDNAQDLIEAVSTVLAGKIDLNPLYNKIDPYGDQIGHKRFGDYLGLWVKMIRKEGNADRALEKVEKAYNKQWPLP